MGFKIPGLSIVDTQKFKNRVLIPWIPKSLRIEFLFLGYPKV